VARDGQRRVEEKGSGGRATGQQLGKTARVAKKGCEEQLGKVDQGGEGGGVRQKRGGEKGSSYKRRFEWTTEPPTRRRQTMAGEVRRKTGPRPRIGGKNGKL